ncbi:MAG: 6-bladed beta-propeller [Mongoliitalea sp.]
MKNVILVFCVLVLTISCAQKHVSEEFLDKILPSFLLNVNQSSEFQWPSTLTVEEVIYLETTDESILSSLDKVYVSPDEQVLVAIDLKLKKVVIFDPYGNVLRVLEKIGQGPDEYLHMTDVFVNFKKNTIEILELKTIQVYDLISLEFLESVSLEGIKGDINYIHHVSIDDVYYIWTPIPSEQRKDLIQITAFNQYHLIRKEGDTVEYFIPFQFGAPIDNRFHPSVRDGEFLLSPILGTSTVYSLMKEGIAPAYDFQFSSNAPTYEELKSYRGNEVEFLTNKSFKFLTNFRETEKYLYFQFLGGEFYFHGLLDKKEERIVSVGKQSDFRVTIIATNGPNFYCYIFPSVYQRLKADGKLSKDHPLLKHVDSNKLDKEDNPVLIKFSL